MEVASAGAPVKLAGEAMSGDIVWQAAFPKCVCGHFHTDGCPCGCSYVEADLGRDDTLSGPTNARYQPYTGVYRGNYTLGQETA